MPKARSRTAQRTARHLRVRRKVRGTADRPRLAVFRSLRHIYAQIIDDGQGATLAAHNFRAFPQSMPYPTLPQNESEKKERGNPKRGSSYSCTSLVSPRACMQTPTGVYHIFGADRRKNGLLFSFRTGRYRKAVACKAHRSFQHHAPSFCHENEQVPASQHNTRRFPSLSLKSDWKTRS